LPISEKTRRSLQELGLTDYEIRAYIALLESGPATASKLSEASDVPYSKLHKVLSSLEKKGWVEMERGRPSRYYPKPPSVGIDVTRFQVEARLKSNEAVVLEELQPLYEKRHVREVGHAVESKPATLRVQTGEIRIKKEDTLLDK